MSGSFIIILLIGAAIAGYSFMKNKESKKPNELYENGMYFGVGVSIASLLLLVFSGMMTQNTPTDIQQYTGGRKKIRKH